MTSENIIAAAIAPNLPTAEEIECAKVLTSVGKISDGKRYVVALGPHYPKNVDIKYSI